MNLWRPYEAAFIRDPYPHYKRLRDEAPVYKTIHNEYVITRHADVRALAGDPRCIAGNRARWIKEITAASPQQFETLTSALSSFMVFQNPPEHTQLRKFVTQAWSERTLAVLVRENIKYLSDRMDWRNADFVTEMAEPLPALTMAAIMGLPVSDYPWLIQQSHVLIKSLDTYITFRDLREMERSMKEMSDYFIEKIRDKKKQIDRSLTGKLIELNPGYSDIELGHTCLFLFIAGEETTSGMMSMGVRNLIQHKAWSPGELNMPLEKLIEELLRLDPPTQIIARTNTERLIIEGTEIAAGSRLSLCLGSANRDDRVFPDPDRIAADRSGRHTSFGAGIHHCLGDWLVRIEATELFRYMLTNFSGITINAEPEFRPNLTLRSLSSLKISTNRNASDH
jgi:cytochrome P450